MGRRACAALAAALACVLPALVPAPAGAASWHGVVTQRDLTQADFELMENAGVKSLRAAIRWRIIQPRLDMEPEAWRWEKFDPVVARAASSGIRLLAVLDAPSPEGAGDPPTDGASRARFGAFVSEVVQRYGPGGEFWAGRPEVLPIRAWQIYNEQNGPIHWRAKPSVRDYAKILGVAADSIRADDPGAEVVLGGMFVTPHGRTGITSFRYLDRLYDVPGAKRDFDTVAVHPYSDTMGGITRQVAGMRDVMRRNGDRRAAMRVSEIGWGSCRRGIHCVGARGQARKLKSSYALFRKKRRSWNLKSVNWFAFQDNPGANCTFCKTAGLVTKNGDPKKSYVAFRRMAR